MIIERFRRLFGTPATRLSPAQKVETNTAENEFTSEGAPLPGESGRDSDHVVKAADADRG